MLYWIIRWGDTMWRLGKNIKNKGSRIRNCGFRIRNGYQRKTVHWKESKVEKRVGLGIAGS